MWDKQTNVVVRGTEVMHNFEKTSIKDFGLCFFIEMFGKIQDTGSEKEGPYNMIPAEKTMFTIKEILCLSVW